jgi:hypothetical protein
VIGLDFGTKYSGFSYCHVCSEQDIITNEQWPGKYLSLKTNTVLQYDDEYNNVISWGYPALLSKRPSRRNREQNNKSVELFKLHLSNLSDNLKPRLPVDYKKAITDYLREIGKVLSQKLF